MVQAFLAQNVLKGLGDVTVNKPVVFIVISHVAISAQILVNGVNLQ